MEEGEPRTGECAFGPSAPGGPRDVGWAGLGHPPEADTSVGMMAGAAGMWKGLSSSEFVFAFLRFFGCISFGNFVFWDYGVLPELGIHGKVDLYLRGEEGLKC